MFIRKLRSLSLVQLSGAIQRCVTTITKLNLNWREAKICLFLCLQTVGLTNLALTDLTLVSGRLKKLGATWLLGLALPVCASIDSRSDSEIVKFSAWKRDWLIARRCCSLQTYTQLRL